MGRFHSNRPITFENDCELIRRISNRVSLERRFFAKPPIPYHLRKLAVWRLIREVAAADTVAEKSLHDSLVNYADRPNRRDPIVPFGRERGRVFRETRMIPRDLR